MLVLRTFPSCLLALAWLATAGSALAQEVRPPHMIVTGTGEVAAAPDMAIVTVAVETNDRKADVALTKNSERMAELFRIVGEAGIEEADRQTRGLGLQTIYDHQSDRTQPRILSYRVFNALTVRVRDLDVLGGLLDQLVTNGANRIDQVRFTFQDPAPLEDLARTAAVEDALAKARLYADAAGIGLGPILQMSEAGGFRPQERFFATERAAAPAIDVPVAGGELTISAQVNLTIALEQPE
ncbi:MAG: SIMPL domain-containing protein [Pseudomonadota bacterium]